MSEEVDLESRVNELLDAVHADVGSADRDESAVSDESLTVPPLLESEDGEQLHDLATEADEIVEGSDPDELLEAFDLYRLPDGETAESIPEAIARGDPEKVADLRTVVKLAKLSGRWDEQYRDSFESAVEDLRKTIERRSGDEPASESEADAESKEEESESEESKEVEPGNEESADDSVSDSIRSATEDVSETARDVADEASDTAGNLLKSDDGQEDTEGGDADTEASADDTEFDEEGDDADDDHDGGLEEAFHAAVEGSIGDFGDEVRDAKERLEAFVDESDVTPGDGESDVDGSDADESDADEPEADELETADDESTGEGDDVSRRRPGRQTTRHSTVSASPSKRPDMNVRTRHSTVPSRDDESLG